MAIICRIINEKREFQVFCNDSNSAKKQAQPQLREAGLVFCIPSMKPQRAETITVVTDKNKLLKFFYSSVVYR